MKFILTSLLTVFASFNLAAQNTIMDYLASDDKFSILVDLLKTTELDQLLRTDEYHTIIAPDNEAFLEHYTLDVLDSLKQNEIGTLNNLMLQQVLHPQ